MSLVSDFLERWTRDTPGAPALVESGRTLSYAELREQMSAVQGFFFAGLRAGQRVAFILDKSLSSVVLWLALLDRDLTVVPVLRTWPLERLTSFLSSLEVDAVLAETKDCARLQSLLGKETFSESNGPWTLLRLTQDERDGKPGPMLVLPTSGSTGAPKAIPFSSEAISVFVNWSIEHFDLKTDDRIGALSPLTFDLSLFDLLGGLGAGAAVCLPSRAQSSIPQALYFFLRDQAVTTLYTVPWRYRQLMDRSELTEAGLPCLRRLLYAGEPFPPSDLRRFCAGWTGAPVTNLYGPAETNVCTYFPIPKDWDFSHPVPVGTSCPYNEVRLFPTLTPGEEEICVSGPNVFQGYLNVSEAPFIDEGGRHWYRTGDLGRWDGAGRLHLRGRQDLQVKVRGVRLELEEIERVLSLIPGVREAVAASLGQESIGAALIVEEDSTLDTAQVRAACARSLPAEAVPERISFRKVLPRLSNGKVDRKAETLNLTREAAVAGELRL